MELLLNTSNPLIILIIILIISVFIFFSKKLQIAWPLIIIMVAITGVLIYHTMLLDDLERGSEYISIIYHCIACDLIYMLISFLSYLWVDDIIAKAKKLKSYDDSLSWFWNKF